MNGYVTGDISGADQAIRRATELGGVDCAGNERRALDSLKRLHEDAQRAMEANDFRRVVFCMDRCLEYSPSSSKWDIVLIIIYFLINYVI